MDQSKKKPSFSCTLCDSDVPMDDDPKLGDIVYCSYCKAGLKIVERKDGILSLEAEDDDEQ